MIEQLSFALASGAPYLLRAVDVVTNSRITGLATGIFTAWYFGSQRARCLQNAFLQPGSHTDHELDQCTAACNEDLFLRLDYYHEVCEETRCDRGPLGAANHFFKQLSGYQNAYHEVRHGDNQVHTPQQCKEQGCNSPGENDLFQKSCLHCTRDHFAVSPSRNYYHEVRHYRYKVGEMPLWRHALPCCKRHACELGLYALALLTLATGAGRIPISMQALLSALSHTAAKMMDGIIVGCCFIGEINVDMPPGKEPSLEGNELPETDALGWLPLPKQNWKFRPAPAVVGGLAYFVLRAADGWFMATMPPNTLPFASLVSKFAFLRL
jgi:hypothetical protein